MKFELNEFKPELSDEEIITDIQRVAKELKKDYISISLYKELGKFSQCAIQGHFGSWKNALTLAGLRNERISAEMKQIKDEDYFMDLNNIAKKLGKCTVTYDDYELYGKYSAGHIFARFEQWDKALIASGLEPTGLARHRIDEQSIFDEIERIWIYLGRQPTSTDIIKGGISNYSIDTYKRRFGGWRKTLEAFVNYINENENNTEIAVSETETNNVSREIVSSQPIQQESAQSNNNDLPVFRHKTTRNIDAKKRFRVLARDNFRCCACGASPAKDPSVDLHVDHIIPWAKGGETVVENLQTLCSKCNLGKSDIL